MAWTSVLWAPNDAPGLEHLEWMERPDGVLVRSVVVGMNAGLAFSLRYIVQYNAAWQVRAVHLENLLSGDEERLEADGGGHWWNASGHALPALDGCIDIDLSATPFTNTLPIRRLGLEVGQSAEIRVAYFNPPDLSGRPVAQRYTCLGRSDDGATYRYEGLDSGFTREIEVDQHGLVSDYPGLFRRVEFE